MTDFWLYIRTPNAKECWSIAEHGIATIAWGREVLMAPISLGAFRAQSSDVSGHILGGFPVRGKNCLYSRTIILLRRHEKEPAWRRPRLAPIVSAMFFRLALLFMSVHFRKFFLYIPRFVRRRFMRLFLLARFSSTAGYARFSRQNAPTSLLSNGWDERSYVFDKSGAF